MKNNDAMLIITETDNKSEEQPLEFINIMKEIRATEKRIAKEVKYLKKLNKKLYKAYSNDMKLKSKYNKKQKKKTNKKSGITSKITVPDDLAKYLNIYNDDKEITRSKLGSLICKFLKEKKLVYEGDGRVYRPDNELRNIKDLKSLIATI